MELKAKYNKIDTNAVPAARKFCFLFIESIQIYRTIV